MNGPRQPRRRCGFSLLELLIALALSVIVVGAISMAVRVHLVNLVDQQKRIELKQVARSVIMMMGNDLRAGVQYKPLDYAGLENLAETLALMQGVVPEEEPEEEESEEEAPLDPDENVTSRPTLFGTREFVTVDISRIPRLDEYNPLTTGQEVQQLPSDIKSVSYFHASQANPQSNNRFDVVSTAAPGGLYRRQIDRAIAAYKQEIGLTPRLDEYTKLVAPEVAQIAFRYFDGDGYVDSWNSEEMGGFPMAIEVTIVIDPERSNPDGSYAYGGFDPNTMTQHQSVIHLLTAEPPLEESE